MIPFTAAVLIDVPRERVMPVPASPRVTVPPTVNTPARESALGAVITRLPPKLNASAELSPSTKLPVFINSMLSTIALVAPVKLNPYGFVVVVSVGVLSPPSNDTTAPLVVLVSTMLVSVSTAPIKRAPPECVTVMVESAVFAPTAPLT